jgi:probable O-glycosylation ligase (exosortase A-associated)
MWGFAFSLPLAMYFAAIILVSLITTKEELAKNAWPSYFPVLIFLAWTTITLSTALAPDAAYVRWSEFWKMQLGLVMTMLAITNRKAITSLIWVLALSIGFYGLKGGLFTIAHGGSYRIWGPVGSAITDNNHLAVALLAAIPLLLWLREQSSQRWIRLALAAIAFLSGIAALGTYSRGALIAAVIGSTVLLVRANRRWPVILGIVVFLPVFASLMPDHYWERIDTIIEYDSDASVQGRFGAWKLAVDVANSHPLGGGFENYRSPQVAAMNTMEPGKGRAAHSIYFQILGDHGWIGLLSYLLMLAVTAWQLSQTRKNCRAKPEQGWAYSLAGYLQVSFVFILTGGAFLSLAYWEFLFYLIILSARLEAVSKQPDALISIATKRQHRMPLYPEKNPGYSVRKP